jgi:hypothetical protein
MLVGAEEVEGSMPGAERRDDRPELDGLRPSPKHHGNQE